MKFGANHAEVERFIAWYDALTVAEVEAIVSRSASLDWFKGFQPVRKHLTAAGMSASVRSALEKRMIELNQAKASVGLDVGRMGGMLSSTLHATLDAVAVRDKLDAEDFAYLTSWFRTAGYDFDAGVAVDAGCDVR